MAEAMKFGTSQGMIDYTAFAQMLMSGGNDA